MITPIVVVIALIILATAGVAIFLYNRKKSTAAPEFGLFGIEALGGFSASRVTALSQSGVPGRPYDISLFASKTPAPPTVADGVFTPRRQWVRGGEIRRARIGMNRF